MMKSVYIETTIPSLATSRLSRDLIIAGRQAVTALFWEYERHKYELYVSQFVIDECSLGDIDAVKRRLEFIKGIPVIGNSERIVLLANIYQYLLGISEKAKTDCFHLAACVISEIDYLLSWNCTHLGIYTYSRIKGYNESNNLFTPLLLTPEALIEISERREE